MPFGCPAASLFAPEFRPVADPSLQLHLAPSLVIPAGLTVRVECGVPELFDPATRGVLRWK